MWQGGPNMDDAGAGKNKKSSGETGMNVQNWPSLEGLGRHPALETLAVARPDGEAIDAFLYRQEFPLAEPGTLTFAWRGQADHVELVRWIHGGGDRRPFAQLAGTDLWLLRLPVEDGGRFEYKLAIGRHGREELIVDPLNPARAGDPFGENSVAGTLGYERPDVEPAARGAGGADRGDRGSRAAPSARRAACGSICRRGTTRSGRYPLVVIHDGDDFVTYADLPVVLDNLIHAGEIPPVIAALVQTRDRLGEYSGGRQHPALPGATTCCRRWRRAWRISEAPGERVLLGASLGAVASLVTAFRYPGRLRRAGAEVGVVHPRRAQARAAAACRSSTASRG